MRAAFGWTGMAFDLVVWELAVPDMYQQLIDGDSAEG